MFNLEIVKSSTATVDYILNLDVICFHSCIFELCISTVHTPTCTGDVGPEQSLVLFSVAWVNEVGSPVLYLFQVLNVNGLMKAPNGGGVFKDGHHFF